MLNTNLQALDSRFPEITGELRSHLVSHADPNSLGAGDFSVVYGQLDPEGLLDRWVARCEARPFSLMVTTGIGNASHIRALLAHLPMTSRVAVLEHDIDSLFVALKSFCLDDLLLNPRLVLLTPFTYRDIIMRLNVELFGVDSSAVHPFSPLSERAPSLYQNLLGSVMRQFTIRWRQIKTDIGNSEVTFRNTVRNLRAMGWTSNPGGFTHLFPESALVLVAAGPSLDGHFEFLRQIQDRAIIAVVNSAYRAVVGQGIRPHLTVAGDPKKDTDRGYEGVSTDGPVLFCPYVVYPDVPKRFSGRTVGLSSSNQLLAMMRRNLQLPDDPPVVGEGTISATVVHLAALFGCSHVFLVGQDLALSRDGRTHTADSFYSDDRINCYDLGLCEWIPGNDGEPVPVEWKLKSYHRIFENLVSHYARIRFHNLSAHGALIHGAPFTTEAEALDILSSARLYPFSEKLAEVIETQRVPESATEAAFEILAHYIGFLERLLFRLVELGTLSELHPEWMGVKMGNPEFEASRLGECRRSILEWLGEHAHFSNLLIEGRSRRLFDAFIRKHPDWALISNPNATLGQAMHQVWALADGCAWQIDVLKAEVPDLTCGNNGESSGT